MHNRKLFGWKTTGPYNNEHLDDADVPTHMSVLQGTESPPDAPEGFLTHPLYAERFHNICDKMHSEHSHIDMLNATGAKEAKARLLNPSYVYFDRCSTFHQNINGILRAEISQQQQPEDQLQEIYWEP